MTDQRTNIVNFYETTLSSEMGSTDLVANVPAVGSLTAPAYVVIEPDDPAQREVILFDGAFSPTQLVTTSLANRYLAGSAAGSGLVHGAGKVVRVAPLGQHIDDLNDRIEADAADFGSQLGGLGDAVETQGDLHTALRGEFDAHTSGPHVVTAAVTNDAQQIVNGANFETKLVLPFTRPTGWATYSLLVRSAIHVSSGASIFVDAKILVDAVEGSPVGHPGVPGALEVTLAPLWRGTGLSAAAPLIELQVRGPSPASGTIVYATMDLLAVKET